MRVRRTAVAGLILAISMAGCTDETFDPCKINPTHLNEWGECVEADGEPCDEDPCDSDDFDGKDSRKSPKPKATKPKTSTTKRR